jgi:hypothetical protein
MIRSRWQTKSFSAALVQKMVSFLAETGIMGAWRADDGCLSGCYLCGSIGVAMLLLREPEFEGRPLSAVLYTAYQNGPLEFANVLGLSELGQLAGGMDYAAVGQAVSRFGKRLQDGPSLRKNIANIERQLSNVEM